MHDLSEGVAVYTISKVLKALIDTKIITLATRIYIQVIELKVLLTLTLPKKQTKTFIFHTRKRRQKT